MERQIKFRAKRLDNGKWAYGGLIEADDYCIIDQRNELYVERDYVFRGDTHFFQLSGVMCDEKTIGQFTGMHDKNGKEIYENDVILQQGYSSKRPMLVRFEHGAFIVGWHSGSSTATRPMLIQKRCEVLGNIYDNPELISKKL